MRRRRFAGAALAVPLLALYAGPALSQGRGPPVPYVIEDLAVNTPLTDRPGDPLRGRDIVRNANNATCLICHQLPIPEEPDHGDIGPPLAGVGARLSEGELRLRLIDPQAIDPNSIMPGYYKLEGLTGVGAFYRGKTIYSSQEIEDVVAYLKTLTEE